MVARRFAPLVFTVAVAAFVAAAWSVVGVADALQAPNPPPGFIALFNGRDLTGWRGLVGTPVTRATMAPEERARLQAEADALAREHWKVEDGVLVYSGKGKITLVTEKEYGNFELYVDWKIHERGDSGIYLRGSPQIQIWDPFNTPNPKNGEEKGSGSLWNNQKNPRFPDVLADNPIGEWNTFFIRMVGEKVWVDLNGKRVVDNVTMENYWERDKPIYPRGQIELQDHGNTLYFRNIYIRELP